MNYNTNRDQSVVVDPEYKWRPLDSCPRGVKVQLKTIGGIAVYGIYHGPKDDQYYVGWAPLPTE